MENDRDGICRTCAAKPPTDGETIAALCGHHARPADARFCVTCAARLGVCRLCGAAFTSPHAEQEP